MIGGLSYDLIKRLARNTNNYPRMELIPNSPRRHVSGYRFWNITVSEMYRFLGILLKISLQHRDLGGYSSYWGKSDLEISGGKGYNKSISGTKGWADDVMHCFASDRYMWLFILKTKIRFILWRQMLPT